MNRNEKNKELFADIKTKADEIYTLLDGVVLIEQSKAKRGLEVLEAAYFVASGIMVSCKSITPEALPAVISEAETLLRYLDSLKGCYGNGEDVSGLFSMALVRATELLNDLECFEELA